MTNSKPTVMMKAMSASKAASQAGRGQRYRPVGQVGSARRQASRSADPLTLFVVAIMSLLTVSTPAVEVFGVPRITVLSVPFTLYMLMRIGWRVDKQLLLFLLAYILAFLPATMFALIRGNIKITSFLQGGLGLITMVAAGTYFLRWLEYAPLQVKKRYFIRLAQIFLAIIVVEQIFYAQFFNIRQYFYPSNVSWANISLDRELTLYGGRPMSMFSEPSHFARYIGLMMAAFIAATQGGVASLWSGAAFMIATRSVSYFFALPAMALQAARTLRADSTGSKGRKRAPIGFRLVGIGVLLALVAAAVSYTQSDRIANALDSRGAVSGDGSLNERLLIPIGYLYDGDQSVLVGLGPTPQDDMQRYVVYKTRLLYNWQSLSADFYSAVSASIFIIVGMGYLGLTVFAAILYFLMGVRGVQLFGAFLFSNLLSSGYNSTTSLLPSGLLLAIILYQKRINLNRDNIAR
ncbi:hypothetical protein [Novosphingobium sp. NDB2Meth1]|uniref:hypothetical protein n=1 Tax=Novosphingobium sp. NDB2Meth1 TaxID=1892847 RepID=UPI000ADCECA5|nr:hypothetical protein [Novosphingobium sp. NDB2Meth1]